MLSVSPCQQGFASFFLSHNEMIPCHGMGRLEIVMTITRYTQWHAFLPCRHAHHASVMPIVWASIGIHGTHHALFDVIQQWHRVSRTDFPTMEQYRQQYDSDLKAGLVRYTNMRKAPKTGVETPFYDVDGAFSSFYIYYELKKGRTFHTPIDADDVERYREKYGIGVVRIEGKIFTQKHPYLMDDLISVQFVQRVITALDDGTAKIVRDAGCPED